MRFQQAVLITLITLGPSNGETAGRKPLAAPKPRPPLRVHVSKETTYFTAPLRKDGGVDYIAALNRYYGKGVTPQNNAAVLFLKAFPPKSIPKRLRREFFQKLGMKPLPETGSYYVTLMEATGKKLKGAAKEAEWERLLGEFDKSTRGPWKGKEIPDVLRWLEANEELLGMLEKASRTPTFFIPLMSAKPRPMLLEAMGTTFELDTYSNVRETARMLDARANLHIGEGRIDKAIEDALTCHRWARLVEQDPWLVGWLCASAIDGVARSIGVEIINSGKITAKQAAAYKRELEQLGPLPLLADTLDVGERCSLLDTVLYIARRGKLEEWEDVFDLPKGAKGLLKGDFGDMFDIDIVLREINGLHSRLVTASLTQIPAKRRTAIVRIENEWNKLKADAMRVPKFLKGKPLNGEQREQASVWAARWLWVSLELSPKTQLDCEDRHRARHDMMLIALALAAYLADHKRYPDKLDKLTPKYIPAIPADRFNGKPLHYTGTKTGFLLYSVGVNGTDDGGRYDHDRGQDDLAIRVPAK